ncbi:MAG: type II toxin-antitoxin system RelE/ParE family toxin [Pseudomonadota bacterium]
MLMTVTELPEYIKRSDSLLTKAECKDVIDYLSEHPRAGRLMQGTGGIRKLRWSRGNKGKSSGVRVIYYYHDARIPLYLLTIFAKNEKENLSKSDRNALSQLVETLVAAALENHHE